MRELREGYHTTTIYNVQDDQHARDLISLIIPDLYDVDYTLRHNVLKVTYKPKEGKGCVAWAHGKGWIWFGGG